MCCNDRLKPQPEADTSDPRAQGDEPLQFEQGCAASMSFHKTTRLVLLVGNDESQVFRGRWPHVEFDTARCVISRRLGRQIRSTEIADQVSGTYLEHGGRLYAIFRQDDELFIFLGNELLRIDRRYEAYCQRSTFRRRFVLSMDGKPRFVADYVSPWRILTDPRLWARFLFFQGGPDDWDFDFFMSASSEIGSYVSQLKG